MIAPFRVESLNNKLSDMNTVESRFLEPPVSRTSRYLEPSFVSIEIAFSRNARQLEPILAPVGQIDPR